MLNVLRGVTGLCYMAICGMGIAIIAVLLSARDNSDLLWTLWQETTGSESFLHEKENLRIAFLAFFWIFITVASASIIIGVIGILSAIFHQKLWLLLVGVISLLVFAVLELAGGIFMVLRENDGKGDLANYVLQSYLENGQDYSNIREKFQCCGVSGSACGEPATLPSCSDIINGNFESVLIWCRWILLVIIIFEILTCIVASAMHVIMNRQKTESLSDLPYLPTTTATNDQWTD